MLNILTFSCCGGCEPEIAPFVTLAPRSPENCERIWPTCVGTGTDQICSCRDKFVVQASTNLQSVCHHGEESQNWKTRHTYSYYFLLDRLVCGDTQKRTPAHFDYFLRSLFVERTDDGIEKADGRQSPSTHQVLSTSLMYSKYLWQQHTICPQKEWANFYKHFSVFPSEFLLGWKISRRVGISSVDWCSQKFSLSTFNTRKVFVQG